MSLLLVGALYIWGKSLSEYHVVCVLIYILAFFRRKGDWKKSKINKIVKGKEKRKSKSDSCGGGDVANLSIPPEVELSTNASGFAVFSYVRQTVLERWLKQACQIYLSSSSSTPPTDVGNDLESDSEENTDKSKENLLRVPKVCSLHFKYNVFSSITARGCCIFFKYIL